MAYDYSDDIAFAVEMVAEYGRPITLTKVTRDVDAANPLGTPAAADTVVADIPAVFVYPSGLVNLGLSVKSRELMKQSEQIAIIAADGATAFDQFTTITDQDGSEWAVMNCEVFKPGPVPVLYYLGVNRP
jgi:hypothetical protein